MLSRVTSVRRRVRREVLRRRRPIAALLTGVAVLVGVRAVAAPPEPTVPVVVAAHDLPAGSTVSPDDLTSVAFRPGSTPDGVVSDPTGRLVTSAVRRGEPITDARLLGDALTADRPDLVATPVRLPDAATVSLLHVGDSVDLLSADPQGGPTARIAESALVLAIPAVDEDAVADALPGRLVVLGLQPDEVTSVAGASVTDFLTVAFAR